MMATALQGYYSAMGENQVVDLCEKIEQLSKDDSHILLDFSVLQEHPLIYQHLQIIKTAMFSLLSLLYALVCTLSVSLLPISDVN